MLNRGKWNTISKTPAVQTNAQLQATTWHHFNNHMKTTSLALMYNFGTWYKNDKNFRR